MSSLKRKLNFNRSQKLSLNGSIQQIQNVNQFIPDLEQIVTPATELKINANKYPIIEQCKNKHQEEWVVISEEFNVKQSLDLTN